MELSHGMNALAGMNLNCGFHKLRLLLDTASAVHRKHRKLMRTQLGHVSHLLRISGAIRSTCTELRSELSVSSSKTSEQQAAVSDSRQQLAKLTARMELLRSAQDEIQSVLGTTKDAIADIKVFLPPVTSELFMSYPCSCCSAWLEPY